MSTYTQHKTVGRGYLWMTCCNHRNFCITHQFKKIMKLIAELINPRITRYTWTLSNLKTYMSFLFLFFFTRCSPRGMFCPQYLLVASHFPNLHFVFINSSFCFSHFPRNLQILLIFCSNYKSLLFFCQRMFSAFFFCCHKMLFFSLLSWMGLVRIRHSSHDFGWQSSHSVDHAGWQAKMAFIEIWIPWRNAHKQHCHDVHASLTHVKMIPVRCLFFLQDNIDILIARCGQAEGVFIQYSTHSSLFR